MEKFSFYELLSFIFPGLFAIVGLEIYLNNIYDITILFKIDNIILESLLTLMIALIVGLLIHILNFQILSFKVFNWYKSLVYKEVSLIVRKISHVNKLVPPLSEFYKQNNRELPQSDDAASINHIVDFAYYHLEVTGKSQATKNIQSLYFWLRNTILLCSLLSLLGLISFLLFKYVCCICFDSKFLLEFIITNICVVLLLIIPTQWLRKKMIIKLFWSFYVETLDIKNQTK